LNEEATAEFARVGARHFPAVLDANDLGQVAMLFSDGDRPGRRLNSGDLKSIAGLLSAAGNVGTIAASLVGSRARPVRALLLDKSEAANWRLGWHQDRTIAVAERFDIDGFGPWSVKAGQLHVQPPHSVTERMVTLRLHVDAVDDANAPLDIIPGSHALGRLSNAAIEDLARDRPRMRCLAQPGDVWAYGTSIVHASSEQLRPGRRRVLQVDYTADNLPDGLKWAELV